MPYTDPQKKKEQNRAWYLKNKERISVESKIKYQQNREKKIAQARAWEQANPEKRRESSKRWRLRHPEKAKAMRKAWEDKHPNYNREYQRERYRQNKEQGAAKACRWRKENPTKTRAARLRRQGVQIDPAALLQVSSVEQCEICQKHLPKISQRCVDHDHITGKIRGILCAKCNGGLGMLGDSPEGLRRALLYLEKTRGD